MTRILIKLSTYVKIGLDWKKQWTKTNITEKKLNFEWNSLGYYILSVTLLLNRKSFFSHGLSSESEERENKRRCYCFCYCYHHCHQNTAIKHSWSAGCTHEGHLITSPQCYKHRKRDLYPLPFLQHISVFSSDSCCCHSFSCSLPFCFSILRAITMAAKKEQLRCFSLASARAGKEMDLVRSLTHPRVSSGSTEQKLWY